MHLLMGHALPRIPKHVSEFAKASARVLLGQRVRTATHERAVRRLLDGRSTNRENESVPRGCVRGKENDMYSFHARNATYARNARDEQQTSHGRPVITHIRLGYTKMSHSCTCMSFLGLDVGMGGQNATRAAAEPE